MAIERTFLIERPGCLILRPEFAKPVNRVRMFDDLADADHNRTIRRAGRRWLRTRFPMS
jgi:hypothetical protein